MKEKQAACVILIICIAAMAWGTQKLYSKMNNKQEDAEVARSAAETAKAQNETARISLERMKAEARPLHQFYEAWDPHLRSSSSPQSTEQRVVDLLKNGDVFAESQRFEFLRSGSAESFFEGTLRANLRIVDEYSKVLNWLAMLEESMPTSRVQKAKLVRGTAGDDLELELVVDFPIARAEA